MSLARRSWLPLTMLAAGLSGLGVLAWRLGAGEPGDVELVAARGAAEPGASGSSSREAGIPSRDRGDARPDAPGVEARRDLFESPTSTERDDLRKLEQSGQARFWGIVRAPDGSACEGATLFVFGEPRATSDAHGAWILDVEHDVGGRYQPFSPRASTAIVARKEGVGTAAALLQGPSRRVDLRLSASGGHRLSGLCVDRTSRRPVGRAHVEMVFVSDPERDAGWSMRLATDADERGRFAFADVPSGTFDLRGHADGHDTNGWVPLDFGGARDRDYTLLFEPRIEVRGTFAPWPPPGEHDAADVPRVVIDTAAPQDSRGEQEPREFTADVDASGSFRCRIPNCPRFVARLVAGSAALWRTQVDPEIVPSDVDLGRIELGPTCSRVRGRVLLPPQFTSFEPELLLRGFGMERGAPLDRAGAFSIALSPAPESVWFDAQLVLLGNEVQLARRAIDDELDRLPWQREGADFVAPELVVESSWIRWLGGRVTDETGEPVAFAQIAAKLVGESEEALSSWREITDARGRFFLTAYAGHSGDSRSWRVDVLANGFRRQRFDAAPASGAALAWCEAKLARGAPLHGTLVDARGAPLVGWQVWFLERDDTVSASALTDAQGEFDGFGLDGAEWSVNLLGPEGQFQRLERVPVVDGAIAMRCPDADASEDAR